MSRHKIEVEEALINTEGIVNRKIVRVILPV